MTEPLGTNQATRDIVGAQVTAGAAEETLLLSLDGAAPAAALAIGEGVKMNLGSAIAALELDAGAPAIFRLQKSVDGGAVWFDIARIVVGGTAGSVQAALAKLIVGGALVQIRALVQTAAAAGVSLTLLAKSE